MAKKRRKGVAVKSRTSSFEDDRHPLKRGGEVHRLYTSFSIEVRKQVLLVVGLRHLQRIGHGRKVDLLRAATDLEGNFFVIDTYLSSNDRSLGVTIPGDVFAPQLGKILENAIRILGSNSERPSVGQLESMCDSLANEHPPEWIKLFLAALVEAHFPSGPEITELNRHPMWGDFLIEPVPVSNIHGDVEVPQKLIDPEVKKQRRVKRRMEQDGRAARQRQREEAALATEPRTRTKPEAVSKKTRKIPIPSREHKPRITVRELEYPRLPSDVTIKKGRPVGDLHWAYISWGPDQGQGKFRPVLVVGASKSKVWVRPCYSEDWLAGLWRAVLILDWQEAGLSKGSFVSIGLVKMSRKSLRGRIGRMSLNDWNRVCRGEVHG